MDIERLDIEARPGPDAVSYISGLLTGLRKVAEEADLERVVRALDEVLRQVTAVAIEREQLDLDLAPTAAPKE